MHEELEITNDYMRKGSLDGGIFSRSLSGQVLDRKGGIFRNSFMGKRTNMCGRCVLTPDACVSGSEVSVPLSMSHKVFYRESRRGLSILKALMTKKRNVDIRGINDSVIEFQN